MSSVFHSALSTQHSELSFVRIYNSVFKRPAYWLGLIVLVRLLIGVSYAVNVPLWQGHEPDTYNVVRFLIDHQRLPTREDYPAGDADTRQATQPPLYFALTAPLVAVLAQPQQSVPPPPQPTTLCIGGDPQNAPFSAYLVRTDPSTAAMALRLLNVVIGAAAVIFTYLAGRELDRPLTGLIGAALFAFEPNTLQLTSQINNDTLLLAISAANLYLCARFLRQGRGLPLIILTALLAPLIRLPGWAVFALSLLVIGSTLIRRLWNRRAVRGGLLGAAVIIGLAVMIGLFNLSQYGSVFGRYAGLDNHLTDLPNAVVIAATLRDTHLSYLDPLTQVIARHAVEVAYTLLPLIGLALSLIVLRRKRALGLPLIAALLAVGLTVLRTGIVATAANTTAYNTSFVFAPLRYYAPGLPALALVIAAGWGVLLPRRNPGGIALALGWLVVAVAGLILSRPPVPALTSAEFAALPGVVHVSDHLGYTLSEPGQYVDLTLYTPADQTPATAQADLLHGDQVVGTCGFVTAYGLPIPAGQIARSHVLIPDCAGDLAPPLSVRIFGASIPLSQPLHQADSCPGDLGTLAGGYRLAKFNSPKSVRRGDLYLPSLDWIVLQPSPQALHRQITFTQQTSGQQYTCVGSPTPLGAVQSWTEYVYADTCSMQFPPDAPLGAYAVSVQLLDAQGSPLADGSLSVGTITLTD